MTDNEILEFINDIVCREQGNRVEINSLYSDTNLDSLAKVIFVLELDEKYHICDYSEVPFLEELNNNPTIKSIIDKCKNANK